MSASAWEEDGKTTIRFIKKITEGVADHPLEVIYPQLVSSGNICLVQGKLTLIWAYGQEDTFYKADHLKYHGRKNRGIASLGKTHCFCSEHLMVMRFQKL